MSISEQYIEAVNQADINTLMGLFAPSAVLSHPAGEFADVDAIRNFYESVVFAGQAITEIQARFTDGDTEILQIRASSPLGEPGHYVHAADVFRIRAGLIERLDIYYR
ncbi:nuclear transport factor 2 family protein [Mycobacterium sp. CVI_P3]|uniref:Nuclear transport factor 2 family protein n=1 Tax=Mycobacterium pinniadriaticum TaxID=2994102 RepID=A0ABT3SG33_9MYCO|nr:nuclear transport factor 2 family protein [Mycobacterium pinniadriaticum]MCX2932050.1 nuclear transport factor 2 family protein [Mycobacterium pinniadriaticum]MCX2938474.1 nuclear transport factor 2 family protein [Mycobacterium pinniadriaticum]